MQKQKHERRSLKKFIWGAALASAIAVAGICIWNKYHERGDMLPPESKNRVEERDAKKADSGTADAAIIAFRPAGFRDKVEKESKGQENDPAIKRIRRLFSGPPVSFSKASRMMSESGLAPGGCRFKSPDKFKLLASKRFYSFFYPVPLIIPGAEGRKPQFITTGYNHIFDTHLQYKQDGRIPALAAHILSKKCDMENPEEAAKTIIWWVMNNVEVDSRNISISAIEHGLGKKEIESSVKAHGYGITHSHRSASRIISSTGLCVDFANLSSDLLNAVGIPSRTVGTIANGYQSDGSLQGLSHMLLQVYLPDAVRYYDVMPRGNKVSIISNRLMELGSTERYIARLFIARHPYSKLFRIGSFAAIPEERLAGYPDIKDALDQGISGASIIYEKFILTKRREEFFTFWNSVEPEVRIYFNDAVMNAMRSTRR